MLVGDEPYYGRVRLQAHSQGPATMPGPVDPARLLVAELVDGAFDGVSGRSGRSARRHERQSVAMRLHGNWRYVTASGTPR